MSKNNCRKAATVASIRLTMHSLISCSLPFTFGILQWLEALMGPTRMPADPGEERVLRAHSLLPQLLRDSAESPDEAVDSRNVALNSAIAGARTNLRDLDVGLR
jgi:hypothetical protein